MHHERGFALYSLRSPRITRLYLQCPPDEDIDDWSDDRIWNELHARLSCKDGWLPSQGRIVQKGVTGMRSFVVEPLQCGRLFLAGDAAHIVPPTGAKGLNLAATDVKYLSSALIEFYAERTEAGIDGYSQRCLGRIWKAERFSWWFTTLMHRFPDDGPIVAKFQEAELDYLLRSESGARTIAENYVGLPLDFGD
jgi:p-hydroxybenzoate 3-monooxygenase